MHIAITSLKSEQVTAKYKRQLQSGDQVFNP